MPLERSLSAPNTLNLYSKKRASTCTPVPEDSDPFNMGGFFPRTKSYLNVTTTKNAQKQDGEWNWVRGAEAEEEEEHHDVAVVPGRGFVSTTTSGSHSPTSSDSHPIATPRMVYDEEEEDACAQDIKNADAFGVLSVTRETLKRTASAPLTICAGVQPLFYDHDHLYHSYDTLHGEMRDRRRRSCILASSAVKPGTCEKSVLFSPKDENELDLSAEEEDGKGDGWAQYLYRGAKTLLHGPEPPRPDPSTK